MPKPMKKKRKKEKKERKQKKQKQENIQEKLDVGFILAEWTS